VRVLPTGSGALACGEEGEGRLLEPEQLITEVLVQLGPKIA
jgi:phosphopantothenoylcysteine decarboxylase/phosphopantothenate--cysteine ligase